MKKKIITIAGRPGSGKSTAAKGVAKILDYEHFSSGDLFRAIAHEMGFDVLQANLSAEEESEIPHIDQLVDQRLRTIGKSQEKIVIDSRLAWHWMPYSFKVFLDIDLTIAASRILGELTPERIKAEHIPSDPVEYSQVLGKRLESESRRYKKVYDVDPYNVENFDLIVNTEKMAPQNVIDVIADRFKDWLRE